ncbi:hypothetical protein KXX44_009320 [Aspergillus fumigatus]|nr:hypothetical protein KXX44_009320 [Aspergillus fumigatus]KAH1838769.1 hypothetical protein KXX55_005425 [Aspergillus fumigatus]
MRWADYLQGIQTHDLLACVAAPEEDPMDATEQVVQVIWDTMEQVALVWSEKGQTLYRPLLAYMDEVVIQKHVQLWQQILAFIARMQALHDWASP